MKQEQDKLRSAFIAGGLAAYNYEFPNGKGFSFGEWMNEEWRKYKGASGDGEISITIHSDICQCQKCRPQKET